MEEVRTGIDSVDGVVDDTPKEPGVAKAPPEELISGLQDQIKSMDTEIKRASMAKVERDEVIDRFSKAIGFIEGTGAGKYDPATGQITKVVPVDAGPDPIDELQHEIESSRKALRAKVDDGDITNEEYWQKIENNIKPLEDKHRAMDLDRTLNKFKEEITSKKESAAVQPDTSVTNEYNKLTSEYPDVNNTNSVLYKKMNEIFVNNPKIYGNANYDNGKGDPDQYADLIRRSAYELKAEGVNVEKEQAAIRDKYATPENKGYQAPQPKGYELSKADVGMMVSQGITSKSLLNDINSTMSSWENTNAIELED